MLHQTALSSALLASIGLELEHGIPLVEPGEDDALRLPLNVLLDMDETSQEIKPVVALPDTLPQIGAAVPVGVWRVAGAQVVAKVEGQEARRLSRRVWWSWLRGRDPRRNGPMPVSRA